MNLTIPFTKDIPFGSTIAEVSSISLEHGYTVNDRDLLGNFTITGEYKTHEVSVNKESFEYVLPFQVELTNERIDKDSIDVTIEDFTYEIIDNNTLRVNIEYKVNALELDLVDEETREEEEPIVIEENIEPEEERIDEIEEEKNIVMNANIEENNYVTYNVHIVKDNENIDTICNLYKAPKDLVESYNDISNIQVKDKIIIPQIDE